MDRRSTPKVVNKLKHLLNDPDGSVLSATLNFLHDVVTSRRNQHRKRKKILQQTSRKQLETDLTPILVSILKQIIDQSLGKQFDFHKIPAPWMQIKILRILGLIGRMNKSLGQIMYEVIRETMKIAEQYENYIGNAIVYECVRTISSIYPNPTLVEIASKAVTRMIVKYKDDSNLRYMAIDGLRLLIRFNPKHATTYHQDDIIECLESPDTSIQRTTLRTLYRMANPTNIKSIINELMKFLKHTIDDFMAKELVTNIIQLTEKYAPDPVYYIEVMNQLFSISEPEYIDEQTIQHVILVIAEAGQCVEDSEQFLKNCVLMLYHLAESETVFYDHTTQLIAWVLGEYAYLVSKSTGENNTTTSSNQEKIKENEPSSLVEPSEELTEVEKEKVFQQEVEALLFPHDEEQLDVQEETEITPPEQEQQENETKPVELTVEIQEPDQSFISHEEILESLIRLLELKHDRDETLSRVISGLQKMFTRVLESNQQVENNLKKTINTIVERLSRSRNTDLSQRCSEFQALQNHPDILKRVMPKEGGYSEIVIDGNMSFLSSFVDSEVKKGAKLYQQISLNPNTKTNNELKLLHDEKPENTVPDDRLAPVFGRDAYSLKKNVSSTDYIVVRSDDLIQRASSGTVRKWTEEGYEEEEPDIPSFLKPTSSATPAISTATADQAESNEEINPVTEEEKSIPVITEKQKKQKSGLFKGIGKMEEQRRRKRRISIVKAKTKSPDTTTNKKGTSTYATLSSSPSSTKYTDDVPQLIHRSTNRWNENDEELDLT
jgi:formylmethanofuran dehydrogenase subunit E